MLLSSLVILPSSLLWVAAVAQACQSLESSFAVALAMAEVSLAVN